MNNEEKESFKFGLFTLRLSVFIVMFMWILDKFVNPSHTAAVFKKYYLIDGLQNSMAYAIGSIQLLILLGFLLGIKKKFTYGFVMITHAFSTLSTYKKLLTPWEPLHLLFFASIPMLAGAYMLYKLRDQDTLLTIK